MSVQNDQTHTHSAGHSEMHGNTSAASKRVTDPVCGMKVDPATAISHQHAGMQHYFCSQHCREKFRVDPDRYLTTEPAVQETAPSIDKKIQHTCPMHPGNCSRRAGRLPYLRHGRSQVPAKPKLRSYLTLRGACGSESRCRFLSWCLPCRR